MGRDTSYTSFHFHKDIFRFAQFCLKHLSLSG